MAMNSATKSKMCTRRDMSTTKIALYLLRFNVSLQIAVFAIVTNLILAVFTFYYGFNALYCAFGADCVIGVLTATILVWRFASSKQNTMAPTEQTYLLRDPRKDAIGAMHNSLTLVSSNKYDIFDSTIVNDEDDHARELWSTFWLGQVMIISGSGVIIRTMVEIFSADHKPEHTDSIFNLLGLFRSPSPSIMEPLFTLALISLILNLVLMVFKIFVYYFLNSNSMLIEGVNSLISSIFALTTMLSIRYSDSLQYLDEVVSLLFGLFFIIYGSFNFLHTINQTLYRPKKKHVEYHIMV